MKLIKALLFATLTVSIVSACAPVIIGGATATGAAAHDRRTVGTFVDDEGIELKARLAVLNDNELNSQIHINITSINYVVLLSGEAPTEALRSQAEGIVRNLPKVRRIHNEMTIAAPSSLMTRSSDTVITAKAKTGLFKIKQEGGFDPTRVKIVTENGIVYLMGLLYRNEADVVTAQVRQVSGVQKVVKLFEYLD
jgi:osmotically-inducible protein OsmY